MDKRLLSVIGGALLLLYIAVAGGRYIALGGATVVKLRQAPPFAGLVSQRLGAKGSGKLPIFGKDYNLHVDYVDGGSWVVVTIKPLVNNLNASVAVFEKQSGGYKSVLGPSSAFAKDEVQELPTNVANYLISRAAIYDSHPGY